LTRRGPRSAGLPCLGQRPPVPRRVGDDNQKHQPQRVEATHPHGFKKIVKNNKESKREKKPRTSGIPICHPPNGIEGRDKEDHEQGEANAPGFQHHIEIAIVGVRQSSNPTADVGKARAVGSYEPIGLISPAEERPTGNFRLHQIPYDGPAREVRIAVHHV
jgi:hypothetical protein